MRSISILIVLAIAAAAAACARPHPSAPAASGDNLRYTLALIRAPFTAVEVTIELAGASDGVTTLDLGEPWAGVERAEDDIHGLAVTGTRGTALPVEHPPGHAWIVRHAPGERLIVTYYLVSSRQDVTTEPTTYHRAVVRDHLVHLIGNTALLVPTFADLTAERTIGLRWRGFAEAGWTLVSSFGVDADLDVRQPLDAFRNAVFLASDDLRLEPRDVGGGILMVALHGAWSFRDDELADAAAAVVRTERAFYADPGPPFFLISAIPVGTADPHGVALSGTGLTQSFALFLSPSVSLTAELGDRLRWLLGHELFHAWNGLTIQAAEPPELAYWFTEGFTNFYARRLLYRAGVVSLDAFVRDLNDEVQNYQLSPVRDQPNLRIQADYWSSRDVSKLPYQRGDLIALIADAEIRRVAGGATSLDDVMKTLVADSRGGKRYDTEALLAPIAARTSPEFAARLRATIVDGAPLAIDPGLLAPCLRGAPHSVPRFDLGFDFDATRADKRVVGVRSGSAAAAAGLRDGQQLAGASINLGQPDKPVTIQIREGSAVRDIVYLPRGAPEQVIRFSTADASACRDLL